MMTNENDVVAVTTTTTSENLIETDLAPASASAAAVVVVTTSTTTATITTTQRNISNSMNGGSNDEDYHPTMAQRTIDSSDIEVNEDEDEANDDDVDERDQEEDDDEEEEEDCDECHSSHRRVRPSSSSSSATSKLSPTVLLMVLQQQLLQQQQDDDVVLRRSRRESTIHSTKSSIQLQKQNSGPALATTKHEKEEDEEGPTNDTNQKDDEQNEDTPSPPRPSKKTKETKPAVTIDPMTTTGRNVKERCPSSVSRPVTAIRATGRNVKERCPSSVSRPVTAIRDTNKNHLSLQQENGEHKEVQLEETASVLPQRRCSVRNRSTTESLYELASIICQNVDDHTSHKKNVVFITGAGLSVDSGIRPFRTCSATTSLSSVYHDPHSTHKTKKKTKHILQAGIWDEVIWTMATRASFRKDPVRWYTQFWNVYFDDRKKYTPNVGHYVMDCLLNEFPNVYQITQNIDGLQSVESNNTAERSKRTDSQPRSSPKKQLIEVHGRCGLYKCCPPEEDDDDDDYTDTNDNDNAVDDDDDVDTSSNCDSSQNRSIDRPVRIGSDKASRRLRERYKVTNTCPYEYLYSLTADQVILRDVKVAAAQQSHSKAKAIAGQHQDYHGKSDGSTDDDQHQSTVPIHNTRYSNQKRKSTTTTMATTLDDKDSKQSVVTVPTCPHCHNIVMPQALLFDESYHDHTFYQYELVEEWIQNASVIVLVGTSCTVQLTTQTLKYALHNSIPIYNMNIHKIPMPQLSLSSTTTTTTKSAKSGNTTTPTSITTIKETPTGSIFNIIGPSSETLPLLLAECRSILEAKKNERGQPNKNNKQVNQ